MPEEPSEKRPRTDEVGALVEGVRFISLVSRKKPTKKMMVACWKEVFHCEFGGWEDTRSHRLPEGMLMVRGVLEKPDGSSERVVLSFWPKTGKFRFQGPHAKPYRHLERWVKELEKHLDKEDITPLASTD